jgi:hypothetical protein
MGKRKINRTNRKIWKSRKKGVKEETKRSDTTKRRKKGVTKKNTGG